LSTQEQRKRFRDYYTRSNANFAIWLKQAYSCRLEFKPMPPDLIGLQCGAKTRAGTPCKNKAIYINARCKWHGGRSTGPKTEEGKRRSAMNGFCPKKKRSQTS